MTDTVVASFERIAALAPGAGRDQLDLLLSHMESIDVHVRACIALGTIPARTLVDAKNAQMVARGEIAGRMNALVGAARRLIDALPDDRASRTALEPLHSTRRLVETIAQGARAVNRIVRDLGDDVRAGIDGTDAGSIDAHAIHLDVGHLVVDGAGRWPLSSIAAACAREDEGLSVLMDDGRHVELLRAA